MATCMPMSLLRGGVTDQYKDLCNLTLVKRSGKTNASFGISNGEIWLSGCIWVWYSEYQEVDIDNYNYYYEIEYSNESGNAFYIGWERFDADKTATSNSSTQYIVSGSKTEHSHETIKGLLDMTNLTGNPTKYIILRILNDWYRDADTPLTATIHKLHLYAILK